MQPAEGVQDQDLRAGVASAPVDGYRVGQSRGRVTPAGLPDRHEGGLKQRELEVPEVTAIAPQSDQPSCQLLEALQVAELPHGEFDAVQSAPDEDVIARVAGQLERTLAKLERLVEPEQMGGDHGEAIQRLRLGGRV